MRLLLQCVFFLVFQIVLFSTSGCRVKSSDGAVEFNFVANHTTSLGVQVEIASWINSLDYDEVGQIIDQYIIDFHSYIRTNGDHSDQIDEQGMALVISERIHSFSYNGTALGCAAGQYFREFNAIVCAWGQITSQSPIPILRNIFPALPHELSHRWLVRRNLPDSHDDFPQFIIEADRFAQQNSPLFTGDLRAYDPQTYNPASCVFQIMKSDPATSTGYGSGMIH